MNYGRLYTAEQLIREYGTKSSQYKCSCCHNWTLYAIRYPDERGVAYLCIRCDVPREAS